MTRERIYLASSWRNQRHPELVKLLSDRHDVYDFQEGTGFSWQQVDPDWLPAVGKVQPSRVMHMMRHRRAVEGFERDMMHLDWCTTLVMVMPCGLSSHLELGWAAGASKRTAVLLEQDGPYRTMRPELMLLAADLITSSVDVLQEWLAEGRNQ